MLTYYALVTIDVTNHKQDGQDFVDHLAFHTILARYILTDIHQENREMQSYVPMGLRGHWNKDRARAQG